MKWFLGRFRLLGSSVGRDRLWFLKTMHWVPREYQEELSVSERRIEPAIKQNCIMSLNATARAPVLKVNHDDVLVKEGFRSGVKLSSAVKEARQELKWDQKSVGVGYDGSFQGLLRTVEHLGEQGF